MTEFHVGCAMPTLSYLRGMIQLPSLIVGADDYFSDHCLNGYSSLFFNFLSYGR